MQMDLTPRPEVAPGAQGKPGRPELARDRSRDTTSLVTGDEITRPADAYAGKSDPDKQKPKPKPLGGKPGKLTPNPNDAVPPTTAGTPSEPGGDIDPRARRANAMVTGDADEDEEVAPRPRSDIRPVTR